MPIINNLWQKLLPAFRFFKAKYLLKSLFANLTFLMKVTIVTIVMSV